MAEAVVLRATRMVELTSVETLQGLPAALDSTVNNDDFNVAPVNYTPSTAVPVSRVVHIDETVLAMTGSAVTIDLTACPGGTQANVDATGKKLQRLFIRNEGNAVLIFQQGATNAYIPFGSTNVIQLPAASGTNYPEFEAWYADQLADVSATVKNLRITAGSGQPFNLEMWFG